MDSSIYLNNQNSFSLSFQTINSYQEMTKLLFKPKLLSMQNTIHKLMDSHSKEFLPSKLKLLQESIMIST